MGWETGLRMGKGHEVIYFSVDFYFMLFFIISFILFTGGPLFASLFSDILMGFSVTAPDFLPKIY